MRIAALTFLLALSIHSCSAQAVKTVVSGTIVDPNGVPYAGGTIDATLLPTGTTPTVAGVGQIDGYVQPVPIATNGSFTLPLYCNTAGGGCTPISPSGTRWLFTVRNPGAAPPVGFGGISFTVTLTITGATQSITSQLQAAAPPLAVFGAAAAGCTASGTAGNLLLIAGGGTGCTNTNELNYNSGTDALTFLPATQTFAGTTIVTFGSGASFGNSITTSAANGIQIIASDVVPNIAIQATGPIDLQSENINLANNGELDLGGTGGGIGSGVLGLVGSTSGKCTLTGNATGTSVASSCPLNIPGATITGQLNMQNLMVLGDMSSETTPAAALTGSVAKNAVVALNTAGQSFAGGFSGSFYLTDTVCSSQASPAACGTAAAGTVRVATSATTLQVNTNKVTANSQIFFAFDLVKTGCTAAPGNLTSLLIPYTSAVSAPNSFTLTLPVAPTTNPVCVDYFIVN